MAKRLLTAIVLNPSVWNLTASEISSNRKRVRGKSWVIASIPMLIVEYTTNRFSIVPFIERSAGFYERLSGKIRASKLSDFWKYLPRKDHEWLLVFAIRDEVPHEEAFKPEYFTSISQGGGYMLDWDDHPAKNQHVAFIEFADAFVRLWRKSS